MSTDWLTELARIYPPDRLLVQAAQLAPYESDALTAYRVRPAAVVIPETQDEVIETVRLCHRYDVPFVARGSGTSLSGAVAAHRDGLRHRPQPAEPHSPARSRRAQLPSSSRA